MSISLTRACKRLIESWRNWGDDGAAVLPTQDMADDVQSIANLVDPEKYPPPVELKAMGWEPLNIVTRGERPAREGD